MDLRSQEAVLQAAEKHGSEDLVVLLGAPDPEAAELAAETVVSGDPAFAGALAEVQLNLPVNHILDEEIRQAIPDDIWDDQVGIMSDVLDAAELTASVARMRDQAKAELDKAG